MARALSLSRVLALRREGGRSLFLSLVLRFAMASTFVPGLKRQSGYRARCSACACTARFSHSWRSAGGSVFHTIPKGCGGPSDPPGGRRQGGNSYVPMILERVLWLPSMLPGTLSDLMKEERKRMNALGGRGM